MKKWLVCLMLCASVSVANATLYIDNFNSGSDDWEAVTVTNSGNISVSDATYNSSGGDPGGYISGSVNSSDTRLYGFQPVNASPWGDMTGFSLTTEFMLDGSVTGPEGAEVRFYVGNYTDGDNYFVTNDTFSWNPNADIAWTLHQVQLLAANFIEWPNQAAHSKTFAQVIAAPQDIGLVFTGNASSFTNNAYLGFSGNGTVKVDNFGTVSGLAQMKSVPEPATVMLLGLGIVSLICKKK